jgi:hypothetical protein
MTEDLFDPKLTAQLTAEIASQNPCCTPAEIMEMVKEEIKDRNTQEVSGNRRRWLKETKHDALYNLEKALPISENSDA